MTGDDNTGGGFSAAADGGDDGLSPFAAALRSDAMWAEPPAGLYAQISAAQQQQPAVQASRWRWPLAAAAAAAVVVFTVGFFVGDSGTEVPAADDDAAVAQIALAGTALAPAAAADVEVYDRGAGYALIVHATGLEPAPEGTYYHGWLRDDRGDEVSVGTFHMRDGDTVWLWSGVAVERYPTLVVTKQRSGVAGRGDEVLLGTLR